MLVPPSPALFTQKTSPYYRDPFQSNGPNDGTSLSSAPPASRPWRKSQFMAPSVLGLLTRGLDGLALAFQARKSRQSIEIALKRVGFLHVGPFLTFRPICGDCGDCGDCACYSRVVRLIVVEHLKDAP